MPIAPTPSPEASEASAAWLLFGETARALRTGADSATRKRLLNNAHRGLMRFETDGTGGDGVLGMHRTTHDAVDAAFEMAYPGLGREQAREALVGRMRAIVSGDGADAEAVAAFFAHARDILDRRLS